MINYINPPDNQTWSDAIELDAGTAERHALSKAMFAMTWRHYTIYVSKNGTTAEETRTPKSFFLVTVVNDGYYGARDWFNGIRKEEGTQQFEGYPRFLYWLAELTSHMYSFDRSDQAVPCDEGYAKWLSKRGDKDACVIISTPPLDVEKELGPHSRAAQVATVFARDIKKHRVLFEELEPRHGEMNVPAARKEK